MKSIGHALQSMTMDEELFFFFLTKQFISNAVSHHPFLLLLDGHSTHFDPQRNEFAKNHRIIIFVCLHTPHMFVHITHVCQPLDCSLFKPLKLQWKIECHNFYQKNPGLVISKFNFCSVFREAWLKAITPSNVVAGFQKAGIFPMDRQKIPSLMKTE